MADDEEHGRLRLRDRVLGTPHHVGWWTLPLFLGIGLLGAILAGTLAVVYYSAQVADLERQTAESRGELEEAVDEVQQAARDAQEAIESEVAAVREQFAQAGPLTDPATIGLATVRAVVPLPAPSSQPSGTANLTTAPPQTVTRTGSAFPVIVDSGAVWFITSFQVVEAETGQEAAVRQAEVTVNGTDFAAAVHSWDEDRDLALLRVDGVGQVPIPPWRPAGEAIALGDRVFAAGLTSTGALFQAGGSVVIVDDLTVVSDGPAIELVRGGPLLDAAGQVVGIVTPGAVDLGDVLVATPIRALCERLVQCESGQATTS